MSENKAFSTFDLLALAIAALASLAAAISAWIAIVARDDFILSTRYAATSAACTDVLSGVANFVDKIAGVAVISNSSGVAVSELPLSAEIEDFRASKSKMEEALFRMNIVAPAPLINEMNKMVSKAGSIQRAVLAAAPPPESVAIETTGQIAPNFRNFSNACRDYVLSGETE